MGARITVKASGITRSFPTQVLKASDSEECPGIERFSSIPKLCDKSSDPTELILDVGIVTIPIRSTLQELMR
jgi:hypothetical protein